MRYAIVAALLTALLGSGYAQAADPEKAGTLVLVPVEGGKKQVQAGVGDLLQFELGYAVVPDKMVSELKLELSGKGLAHVATVAVPRRAENGQTVVGVMAIAGFVRADQPGDYTVKIVPRLATGKDGPKSEFKVKVAAK